MVSDTGAPPEEPRRRPPELLRLRDERGPRDPVTSRVGRG